MRILVINCGSTTLKYKLFAVDGSGMQPLVAGVVEISGGYRAAVAGALEALPQAPEAIAHRVVHGGDRLPEVVAVNTRVLNQLRELGPLAPLHNGPALEGIEATLGVGVPLVAAFDTAFHHTLPERAWRYALPELPGVRRYGFHGWSHRSVTERYAVLSGNPQPTIVTLHLGSGCSVAAIQRGQSIDTSMGYTPLEGLVMGTRAGDLDPGILTHLMEQGMTPDSLRRLLHQESGLQGLAGSHDMRELLRRDDHAAVVAIEIFCYRILKYVGAYLTVLRGAEAIVFTGGIGENSPEIRGRICEGLRWLGLEIDDLRNARGEERLSTQSSRMAAYAIRTDEEKVIAREAYCLLVSGPPLDRR
ncbi:MAG TPA: acetate/propionate family kinase [Gemmatimonadales bacterium]